jgi:hypothetical protein
MGLGHEYYNTLHYKQKRLITIWYDIGNFKFGVSLLITHAMKLLKCKDNLSSIKPVSHKMES